jgi:hypothetical protein
MFICINSIPLLKCNFTDVFLARKRKTPVKIVRPEVKKPETPKPETDSSDSESSPARSVKKNPQESKKKESITHSKSSFKSESGSSHAAQPEEPFPGDFAMYVTRRLLKNLPS